MKKNPPKRKNVSQRIPNGRTLQTRDEFLASGKGKTNIKPDHPNPRDLYRTIAVVDSNRKNELAIVKLTTSEKAKKTLPNYRDGKSKYKTYVEVYDNSGKRIKIDGRKFIINEPSRDLTKAEVNKIKKDALKKAPKPIRTDNRKKIRKLKGRK